jgi:DNA-directed RNA polymerase subunit E'
MEALLHKSQILETQVEVNVGAGIISGRDDDKRLGIGTAVRARIVSLSPDTSDPRRSKIGLTCKQPGLGSLEWLHAPGE